ncbi:hypothetical protein Sj15T_34040 [Sphingobium sp. TA15]|nr:hypothetical protein Sj15T_34040 [Sphingobium sp. TA15]
MGGLQNVGAPGLQTGKRIKCLPLSEGGGFGKIQSLRSLWRRSGWNWPIQDIPLPQAGGARGGREQRELLTWPLQNNADVAPAHPLTPSRLREGGCPQSTKITHPASPELDRAA